MGAARGWRGLAAGAVAFVVAAGVTGSAGTAHAGGGRPAAQIDISPYAKELARGAMLVHLTARCAPGHVVQELVLDYAQGTVQVSWPATVDLPCDGRWHRLRVTGPEAFEPGHADVSARLTILDQSTGDPAPQAVDSQRVWVEPAAKVKVGSHAKLRSDGSAVLSVWVRCDQPWIVQDLVVELRQGAMGGTAIRTDEFFPCDDRWHHFLLEIAPSDPTTPFTRGPADVQALLSILDAEHFDPVTQARHLTTVRIRG